MANSPYTIPFTATRVKNSNITIKDTKKLFNNEIHFTFDDLSSRAHIYISRRTRTKKKLILFVYENRMYEKKEAFIV